MRYAIFSDIHANLEALEAVLAKIDEIAEKEPIDAIWFLGDLVGYGPDPNECIVKLRECTDIIIAGNHDWAAVGKIDLADFSAAARISAEWTAEQLTEEHREFLANLPERLEIGDCTLVHGSPYGPLWEYLTSEVLAERSFQHFSTRYCFVGHTHVPVIFQQPDIANAPTHPLQDAEQQATPLSLANGVENHAGEGKQSAGDEQAAEMAAVHPAAQQATLSARTLESAMSAYKDPESGHILTEDKANTVLEAHMQSSEEPAAAVSTSAAIAIEDMETPEETPAEQPAPSEIAVEEPGSAAHEDRDSEHALAELQSSSTSAVPSSEEQDSEDTEDHSAPEEENVAPQPHDTSPTGEESIAPADLPTGEPQESPQEPTTPIVEAEHAVNDYKKSGEEAGEGDEPLETAPEYIIIGDQEHLDSEIEELLTLLGLTQSMIQVTNEMITPPEGHWEAPVGYRAIINPGGVGQPRDGDSRAAFMIYDTERGFEFYRVPYPVEKTQEKIIKAGLPHYLAIRLAYGR